jgi:hypothetical protein
VLLGLIEFYKPEIGLVLERIRSAILVLGEHRLDTRRLAWILQGNLRADFLEEGKPNLPFVELC